MFRSTSIVCATLGILTTTSIATVTLSNLADLPDRIETTTVQIGPSNWQATPFTTDGSSYQLSSIIANIGDFNPGGTLFMEIWDTSAFAAPSSNLQRLTLDLDTNGVKTWSSNLTLSANTSYFVVVGVDNGGGQWRQFTNLNDPVTTTLGDFRVDQGSWQLETDFMGTPIVQSYYSGSLGVSWLSDGATGAPLRMEMDASSIPEPSSSILTIISLAGLSFRRQRSSQGF